MLIDNFEQHFVNFVLKVQNVQKSAQNQINRLSSSKNVLMKIFRGFRVFEYALWQKAKTRKCRKSTESFLNWKHPLFYGCHYQKTAGKPSVSLLERQLIEKSSVIDFLVKHQMSPRATYSNVDCDNKILNNESTEVEH